MSDEGEFRIASIRIAHRTELLEQVMNSLRLDDDLDRYMYMYLYMSMVCTSAAESPG
jgi:hypothetical protein